MKKIKKTQHPVVKSLKWLGGITVPALGLAFYGHLALSPKISDAAPIAAAPQAEKASAVMASNAPTSNSLDSWKHALWVAQPAEYIAEMPLKQSYATIDDILRKDSRPVPLVRALLEAKLTGGAQELLHPRSMGERSKNEAKKKLGLIKNYLLTQLASAIRVQPGRFRDDVGYKDLEARLSEFSSRERNPELARAAARVLGILRAGDQSAVASR